MSSTSIGTPLSSMHHSGESATNRRLPSVKGEIWESLAQKWLDDSEDIVGDHSATRAGRIEHYLIEFCSSRAMGKTKDDVLMGLYWTDEAAGGTYFVLSDFTEFLKQRREVVPMNKLERTLLDFGGLAHPKEVIKGRSVTLWSMPKPSLQSEPFDVPRMPREEPF
jgi:hypothetical protein